MRKTIPNLGQFGIIKDASAEELPENAWTDGRNVRFRNKCAERFGGEASLFTPAEQRYWAYCLTKGGGDNVLVTVGSTDGVWDGNTDQDISGSAQTAVTDKVVGDELSGIVVYTNRADPPQYWAGDTGTPFAAIPDWPANWLCQSIRAYKNYLVALGIYNGTDELGQMIKISAAADPGAVPTAWTPANTNDAEERDMPGKGVTIDSLLLGTRLIIYKSESYGYLQFIGGSEVFQTDVISQDYGMLAPNCAAQFPGGHIVLASGDVYIHSGGLPTPILEDRMREWLFSKIDTDNRNRCFVVTNPRMNEAWICYPEQGRDNCTSALVWNWKDDEFSIRELSETTYGTSGVLPFVATNTWESQDEQWDSDNFTWANSDFSQTEKRLVMVRQEVQDIVAMDQNYTIKNDPATLCYIERHGYNFGGDPWALKTLKTLFLRLDAVTGVEFLIYFGSQQTSNSPIVWQPPVTYVNGTDLKVDAFSTGRFNAIRIECRDASPWRLRSFDVEWEMAGMY